MATEADVTMDDIKLENSATNEKRAASPLENPKPKRSKYYTEMNEQERAEWREEHERQERFEHPWWQETGRLLNEPPDINYRKIMVRDNQFFERLWENEDMHFTERCLEYQTHDLGVEVYLLLEYRLWASKMLANSCSVEDKQKKFFNDLSDVLYEDLEMVGDERRLSECEEAVNKANRRRLEDKGPLQYFDYPTGGWYYDKLQHKWEPEPTEKGSLYEERLLAWRREALKKKEQQYYDCVEGRFYHYAREEDLWVPDAEIYGTWDASRFKYDKSRGRWIPNQWAAERAKKRYEESIAKVGATATPPVAHDAPADTDSEGYQTANEDAPSPHSSIVVAPEDTMQIAEDGT